MKGELKCQTTWTFKENMQALVAVHSYGGIYMPSLVRYFCRLVRSLCWLVNYLCRLVRSLYRLVRKTPSQLEALYRLNTTNCHLLISLISDKSTSLSIMLTCQITMWTCQIMMSTCQILMSTWKFRCYLYGINWARTRL